MKPGAQEALAEALRSAASRKRTIALEGNGTKRLIGGPVAPADETISTSGLTRVLQYEPHDLTISVEAGMPWRELVRLVAANRQMIPLDPAFTDATVGGVIAANSSGPRRLRYGTARDMVIGMRFATLEGKLVQSGGMVVKNVAGLDMAKLMIGSFGTLAAIASVNFKVAPIPEVERSFLLAFESVDGAIAARDRILASALQPSAVDLLNPAAGQTVGNRSWLLAIRVAGNESAIARCERELAAIGSGMAFEAEQQATLWRHIENFTPQFLAGQADGAVIRCSCTLKEVGTVMASWEGAAIARAGSGVCYGYFDRADRAAGWLGEAGKRGWKAVIEFAPESRKQSVDLWPSPGADFEIMHRIKKLFDPDNLLNRGRLYGRI